MRTALEKTLRKKLEDTVVKAREIVEVAVYEALTRLGISEGSSPSYLSEAERKLRTRLRAHGRQLGDVLHKETTSLVKANDQETELLINEMSYEHWHRMLFARFLEQSDLLMYEPGTPVTLDECFELAEEEPDPLTGRADGWDLAGRLAEKMLPQIFRADSPVFEVKLSINHVNTLEELIATLHPDTFQASDSLGWCYQFWQNKKKKQVNESGVKIGAKELSPVTQLFTEPYMVSFLLDNALGAWWAKRRLTSDDLQTATSEQELRELAAIPGVPLEYLRFIKDEEANQWKSAAGDFDKWPGHLSELKTLDPCCGSGHFLVAKFLMLVPMRMQLEALTAKQAIDKVISENIHGLELDQRCVELAVFALALEAWRYPGAGGYRQLPELQLACSGMSINEAQKEWKDLAKDDGEMQGAIKWMQETFKDAPTLGSLIEPKVTNEYGGFSPWKLIQTAMEIKSESTSESNTTAQGLSKAAELLMRKYDFVVTNVPYLGQKKYSEKLKSFITDNYELAKSDLALVFTRRLNKILNEYGYKSLVLPSGWMLQSNDESFRKKELEDQSIKVVCNLGGNAFSTPIGAQVSLYTTQNRHEKVETKIFFADCAIKNNYLEKIEEIKVGSILEKPIKDIRENSKIEIVPFSMKSGGKIGDYATSLQGLSTGEKNLFERFFWEFPNLLDSGWEFLHETTDTTNFVGGRSAVILWEKEQGKLAKLADSLKHLNHSIQSWRRGKPYWDKPGIAVNRMGNLFRTNYSGEKFSVDIGVISPLKEEYFLPLYAFAMSDLFIPSVRAIYHKPEVPMSYLVNVPFDYSYWKKVADLELKEGLPLPYSNCCKQWVFHGHPCVSVSWNDETQSTEISGFRQEDTVLQVAVARLLGYRWPAELDAEMELAPEMREIVAKCKDFDSLVDDDGIVCIPAIRGEKSANDRLEAILHAAYGDEWSATVLNNLLKSVKSTNLTTWLRDKFFEQHSKLFQHRPFIWQVWDGMADGFSALVNYHTLDYKGLERLIYTYLDDWISTQVQLEKDGVEGAELRLSAARNLKESLEAILVGESNDVIASERKGLDIFVRWKSPAEQAIGWNPDLNDGVRLNIRPFMQAKDVGKKGAGILRSKPNIHWKKDRGTDVVSAPWFDLGLEYGGKQGDRINDHHLTLAEKKAAREAAAIEKEEQSKGAESV